MKRILFCLTAIALAPACKKGADTTPPTGGDTGGGGGGGETKTPAVAQEPDPPAIADARKQYIAGQYTQVVEGMRPLVDELKAKQQVRASGLSASWLALALAEDVVENSKEPADHALAMAEQSGDAEVLVLAKLAQGIYKLRTDDFAGAAVDFEAAFNAQKDGPNAGLALVMYGNTKINMAFGEEGEAITKPGELDSAASTFTKAQRLIEKQPGNELIGGRALEGLAAVARYKQDSAGACKLIGDANKVYTSAGAGQPLLDGVTALQDAANCTAPPAK